MKNPFTLAIIGAAGAIAFMVMKKGGKLPAVMGGTTQPAANTGTPWVRRDIFGNWTTGSPSDGVYAGTMSEQNASLLAQCGGWTECLNQTAAQAWGAQ